MFTSSRTTAYCLHRLPRALFACLALFSLSAAPALADHHPQEKGASSPVEPTASQVVETIAVPASQTPAKCEGQTFSQPYLTLGDSNYYTPVPGGEFNSASEGWQLQGGAKIIQTTRPEGTSGGALDLPSGALAISPPVCVTLQYPTARLWLRNVKGNGSVAVAVGYPAAKALTTPATVGELEGQQGSWMLSEPISVDPQIAGSTEETREARFVFYAAGKKAEFQLYGLNVDPRMI